jgi:hypothetical protein
MIIQRLEHSDRPNEVSVFWDQDTLEKVNEAIAERGWALQLNALPEEHQRSYCRSLLDATRGEPKRYLVDLESDVRLDSEELGSDIVKRFSREQDTDDFDPDYQPVDFILRVFDDEGSQAMDDFRVNPSLENIHRVEQAINLAAFVVSFSLSPPNLT